MKVNIKFDIELFFRFFKISALTFGGGYVMMPMMESELVEKAGLISEENVLNDYAIGQSIPGTIGVNTAALIGYRISGRVGLISAVLGFITPSIIIITLLTTFLLNVQDNTYVNKAFIGLRAGVIALMLNSLINIAKRSLKSFLCYLLFFIAIAAVLFLKFHPIFLILFGGIVGLINGEIRVRGSK